ncbi:MAG: methyltransferase domain-containing protein [Desulfobulbaceae bacterium]|nr:methyltransferase domain-containing protein [Desulfobulbaceae bacterium]
METINDKSRTIIEFELDWQSRDANHRDAFWADPVNFWRDCLDQSLYSTLMGAGVNDKVKVHIPRESFPVPYTDNKLVRIRPSQFMPQGVQGKKITPQAGRFYPQSFLHGVSGVFKQSLAPCRFIGFENNHMLFDLNHPLSPYDTDLQATVRNIFDDAIERGGRCEDWLEKASADGPGMQALSQKGYDNFFTEENLRRSDATSDRLFYNKPRLVHHLDSTARKTIRRVYTNLIGDGADVLDLMGSWDSHLADTLKLKKLAVLGLNEEELAKNTKATETFLQDLNMDKTLPFKENSFDAVVCTASVEYLVDPISIFREVNRILRNDGIFALSFSNRWFPPKAIRIWTEIHEFERMGFVLELFRKAGNYTDLHTYSRRDLPRPDDDPHPELLLSDPVSIVWGKKRR